MKAVSSCRPPIHSANCELNSYTCGKRDPRPIYEIPHWKDVHSMPLTLTRPLRRQKKSEQPSVETPETDEGAASNPSGRRSRLREAERLRSVLKESTFGAAVDTLEKNLRFRLLPDAEGNSRWLALMLRAEAIGGLNSKTKRDEAKGSLVQQIVSDQIEAVATDRMLEEEFFAIVPSEDTLERMSEYSMLTGAQYGWIVFSAVDGFLVFDQNIGPASYEDAVAIQSGRSMQDVITAAGMEGTTSWSRIEAGLGAGAKAPVSAESEPESESSSVDLSLNDGDEIFSAAAVAQAAQTQDQGSAAPEAMDSDGFYENLDEGEGVDDLADQDDYDPYDDGESVVPGEAADRERHGADAEELEPVASPSAYDAPPGAAMTPYANYLESTKDAVFTEADVQASIARRFLSEDLDLTIDMREFELAFAAGPAPTVNVSASVPDGSTDWLGRQIAQMADAANSELAALHQRHDSELRQLHIDYTSRHIQEVISEVSVVSPTSRFGAMMDVITRECENALDASHVTVTQRRQEIDQRYTAEAEQAAEAAASQARLTHTQVTRGRREAEMISVDREVEQDIQARFENERQQLLRLRRADADLGMQRGKTAILEALGDERLRQSEAESRLLAQWNQRILDLVEENRKHDVARAETLAEQLSRSNAVDDERRRMNERIEEMRAEHKLRVAALEQLTVRAREDAVEELKRHEAEWRRKLGQAEEMSQEQAANSGAVIEELQRQIREMNQSYSDQYEERIQLLESSKRDHAKEVKRVRRASKRTIRALIVLMVMLAITGIGVGIIAGWAMAHVGGTAAAIGVLAPQGLDALTGHLQL
ncbi:hypothetical protein [Arthrobacter bambusae]|uniref:Uncharacterized protein n=1 Tax=Arthrobacter bambusae TaxID=1338426 RepID=A0AAW8DA72_9MICC|nr:hypothetical protein [Arthrobacter bambusae]MDP9903195.1 hypothetical protein [Arthrobacter bambusae]MDQ0128811.1 hypothetical protein [Arthrobacter bambusae]MDQ0180152.1 hypothetical protein [Arthrobacter bambusae]